VVKVLIYKQDGRQRWIATVRTKLVGELLASPPDQDISMGG